jgi:hypothetical protein
MHAFVTSLLPASASALAQVSLDSFVRSDQFLTALAQLLSSIVLQVLNVFLFGGSATL